MKWLKNLFNILDTDISTINRRIFSLPTKGVSPREIIFNKHLQNLIWVFWFGKPLHKEDT